ncbi:MAG: hypothetical protein ACXW3D_06760, partial [Caulobacteraceae bacterium]
MRIGYYDSVAGSGVVPQGDVANLVTRDSSVSSLSDVSAASISGLDVLWVQNSNTAGYDAELLFGAADVVNFVS